ncbi:MAG: hypothetical protein EPO20_24570 [Betaproteobacteria bacterium]|nr:MAG: hypothetical protein EPO20_24570 [Betaproteobacteria bacterium]
MLAVSLAVQAIPARAVSFSTDFDGSRLGGSISISRFQPSSRGSERDSYSVHVYENYVAQREEAEKRARIEKEIEDARRAQQAARLSELLRSLDRLSGADDRKRYRLKAAVIQELEPRFQQEQQEERNRQRTILQRLMVEADRIRVPSPPTHYRCVFIGGTSYSPEDAKEDAFKGLRDPFINERFGLIVGPGTHSRFDMGRSTADHIFGERDRLSAETMARVGILKGTEVDELVCHSNGCMIARVLIQTGFIRKVYKLRVLGGDAAITNIGALAELRDSRGVQVSVYAVKGDGVPLTPTGWQILDAMKRIGAPLQTFQTAGDLTYEVLGLKPRKGFDGADPVQVQVLSPLVADQPFPEVHGFRNYFGIIGAQRRLGLLRPDGDPNPEAMLRSP